MYNMRAERLATENGPGLLWHVLDRDGRSLCGQPLNGKATVSPEGAMERDDYCHLGASFAGAPAYAQRGERRA
ncbi:hypothetical protein [Streptomyces acidicola]|uniref:hypothetical protein n=1 Tax=Streptomyces acidicola TaxID=2596892 RepID=UPI00341CE11F